MMEHDDFLELSQKLAAQVIDYLNVMFKRELKDFEGQEFCKIMLQTLCNVTACTIDSMPVSIADKNTAIAAFKAELARLLFAYGNQS